MKTWDKTLASQYSVPQPMHMQTDVVCQIPARTRLKSGDWCSHGSWGVLQASQTTQIVRIHEVVHFPGTRNQSRQHADYVLIEHATVTTEPHERYRMPRVLPNAQFSLVPVEVCKLLNCC